MAREIKIPTWIPTKAFFETKKSGAKKNCPFGGKKKGAKSTGYYNIQECIRNRNVLMRELSIRDLLNLVLDQKFKIQNQTY